MSHIDELSTSDLLRLLRRAGPAPTSAEADRAHAERVRALELLIRARGVYPLHDHGSRGEARAPRTTAAPRASRAGTSGGAVLYLPTTTTGAPARGATTTMADPHEGTRPRPLLPEQSDGVLRSVSVEEQLLVVDAASGRPVPRGHAVAGDGLGKVLRDGARGATGGGAVLVRDARAEHVAVRTPARRDVSLLGEDLRALRRLADAAARGAGARVVALGTSPLAGGPVQAPGQPLPPRGPFTPEDRAVPCGSRVGVAVASPEEAVGVLDRIRPWLAVLTALTANSPFCDGHDTGFASYRTELWSHRPAAGAADPFGSLTGYGHAVARLLATGALADGDAVPFEGCLGPDRRTVEVQVTDVCLDVEDAVLLAALVRALVGTAARAWAEGHPPAPVPTHILRLAAWRARRSGLGDELVHPWLLTARPAEDAVHALLDHTGDDLALTGDGVLVERGARRLLRDGTGADYQRDAARTWGHVAHAVAVAVERTVA